MSAMQPLLIEIGTDELPVGALPGLAQAVAEAYYAQREKLGFPGLKKETA